MIEEYSVIQIAGINVINNPAVLDSRVIRIYGRAEPGRAIAPKNTVIDRNIGGNIHSASVRGISVLDGEAVHDNCHGIGESIALTDYTLFALAVQDGWILRSVTSCQGSLVACESTV